MTIINRVRSVAADRLRPTLQGLASVLPGDAGTTLAGIGSAIITGGPAAAKALIPSKAAIPDLVLGEVARQQSTGAAAQARSQADQLRRQREGRPPSGVPATPGGTPVARSTGSAPVPWAGAPMFGGLTLERYRQLYVESGMTPREFKNLFWVGVSELVPSREAPAGPGPFNLLAMDVSFSPCTMPGDALQVGSANIDSLVAAERVEVRLTTLDDARGSIKRWFTAKADQAAHRDGTFGLPAEYLLILHIVQMDVLGESSPADRLHYRYLVRPSNVDVELSRRAAELGEVPMSFVQFDTFMEP